MHADSKAIEQNPGMLLPCSQLLWLGSGIPKVQLGRVLLPSKMLALSVQAGGLPGGMCLAGYSLPGHVALSLLQSLVSDQPFYARPVIAGTLNPY